MARILLGVSGGIAAYKALELVRLATKAGHAVRVVQTPASRQFVGPASFAGLTGAPVLSDEFERDPARGAFADQPAPGAHAGEAGGSYDPISHLELVRNADVLVVAPASANTVAKLAHGLADNLLTSAALAATCPVVVAPAMNNHMYEHPATQANLATLRGRGVTVLDPGVGALASKGEHGAGRLVEPADLLAAVEAAVGSAHAGEPRGDAGGAPAAASRHLVGVRVLVTAGGTREPIDAVRFVGNRSSGRMGFALAEAAAALGADVTVVAANVALERHPGVRYVDVGSAAELQAACDAAFPGADVLLMAAAVADFRPVAPAAGKIKKAGRDELALTLEPTGDVLSALAARRRLGQTIVGFAAEHGEDAVAQGREKLARKGLDAVVINDIARADIGFEGEHNEVTIVTARSDRHVERATKADVARAVLDCVVALRAGAAAGHATQRTDH